MGFGITRNLGDLQAWRSYTPTLIGTSSPTVGTGTAVGHYAQTGKIVVARFKLTWGTGSTAGTGAYYFALPVAAAAGQVGITAGNGYSFDQSAVALSPQIWYVQTSTRINGLYNTTLNGAYGVFGAGTPFTWANGDYVEGIIEYEAA